MTPRMYFMITSIALKGKLGKTKGKYKEFNGPNMICDGYNKAWTDCYNAANGREKAIPGSNKACNGCNKSWL